MRNLFVDDHHLGRAHALVAQAIRRRWAEGLITRDSDGVFTSFLGADAIDRLLDVSQPAGAGPQIDDVAPRPDSRLGRLAARLRLTPTEVDVVAVLLACETDPTIARLASYLGGNQSQFTLTMDLLFEIVYRPRAPGRGEAAALLAHDLEPSRPLRRLRYVIVDRTDDKVALARGIRMAPRVAAWLLGGDGLDPALAPYARLVRRGPAGGIPVDATAVAHAERALAGGRLLCVEGPRFSGREELVRRAAEALGRDLLVVRGEGLGDDRMPLAFREATLHDAVLVVREAADGLAGAAAGFFRDCLAAHPGPVALVGAGRAMAAVGGPRPIVDLEVAVPGHDERGELWRGNAERAAAAAGIPLALDADAVRELAGLYNLGAAGVLLASQAAADLAAAEGAPLRREHVSRAMRQILEPDLTSVATRVEVTQTWDDIVLTDEARDGIDSVLDRVRFRGEVLGGWGFARKLGKGLGVTVLLSGPPGTGKSMVAGLIARELGLDLYVVDLSRLASKWLGETEKNLARAFDAAETGHVLLLFDEADTVLAKRADVRSANDRHANMETNYILARLEQFQGLAFFTSNLPGAIDPAVARRMSAHIRLDLPDARLREQLWRRLVPAQSVEGGIDFGALARRYELSGGFVRNIVLRAAFMAARDGRGITMDHLSRGAQLEYHERGSLQASGRLV